MGRLRVRRGIVFVVALEGVLLLFVLGGVALLPDGTEEILESAVDRDGATPDGLATSDEELVEHAWLAASEGARNASKFGNDACFGGCGAPAPYEPPSSEFEHRALLESLSPGVRARYDGALRKRADALDKQRERDKAEYAVFIEARMRRLSRK